MPHTIILGITEYGKTTLAKSLCHQSKTANRGTIVLDPMHDEWDCHFKTANKEEFLQAVWASRDCDIFVDEAGKEIGHYGKLMIDLATQGRQWGHNCYFITQDSKSVSPILRGMCTKLYCFALARSRITDLAIDWNKPELYEVAEYPPGVCMYVGKKPGEIERFNIFT